MKRKDPESDTLRNDPKSSFDRTFVDEHQVRAFADSLVDRPSDESFERVESRPSSSVRGASSSRPSPGGQTQNRATTIGSALPEDREPETKASSQPAPDDPSLANTLPSLIEEEKSVAESTGCLPEDTIIAFVEGSLDRAELVRAHRHLDACETCQILVAEAAHVVSGADLAALEREPAGANLRSGTLLADRYRIQRFIARGGMGEVYEAYDRVLRERVALKTVTATVCDSPRAVRRLMAEVQLARRVSHPNVCRIYDLGSHADAGVVHFLTMEYVPGESLAKRLRRDGFLQVDEAVHVARQLLRGLEAAHEAGILHRDFKTDNVMLSPQSTSLPRPVIMDFGLARALDADPGRLTTGANQPLVGTLSYMAPEQVEGDRLSVRTDIYSFGIVFYEMLTGHLPFVADSPAATALSRLRDRPKRPSHYFPGLRPELDAIVLRCLSRDPDRRYGSAREVLRELDALTPEPRAAAVPPRIKRLALLALGALGVVAVFWLLNTAPRHEARSLPAAAPAAQAQETSDEHVRARPVLASRPEGDAASVTSGAKARPLGDMAPQSSKAKRGGALLNPTPSAHAQRSGPGTSPLGPARPDVPPRPSQASTPAPPAEQEKPSEVQGDDLIVPEIFEKRSGRSEAHATKSSAPTPPPAPGSRPPPSGTGG